MNSMSEDAVQQALEAENWDLRASSEVERSPRRLAGEGRSDLYLLEGQTAAARKGGGSRREEFEASLALVQEACESIHNAEQRINELETELEEAAVEARRDLQVMVDRIRVLQEEVKAANAKVAAAETRATQAEEWLTRLNTAIMQGFGSNAVGLYAAPREQEQIRESA